MPRGEYLGEFEQLILLAVARTGPGAYGISILDEIEARTGSEVAVGSVYAALDRLERRSFVESAMGSPTAARGGRAKRFYRLTPAGAHTLRRTRAALDSMWDGLELDPDAPV